MLGFTPRTPPAEAVAGTPGGAMMSDVLGPRFGRIRYAIMSTPDGVHVEVFEPGEPALSRPDDARPQFWRAGPWHIAVTVADVGATAASIAATGGRVLSEVHALVPDQPYQICMCVDPFGVTVELYSHDLGEILTALGA